LRGKRNEGMNGPSIIAIRKIVTIRDVMFLIVEQDIRYVVLCKGCPLSAVPARALVRTEDKEGPNQPPPPPPRA
jgi:hypothetical protein